MKSFDKNVRTTLRYVKENLDIFARRLSHDTHKWSCEKKDNVIGGFNMWAKIKSENREIRILSF